jgi:hypothetical protein
VIGDGETAAILGAFAALVAAASAGMVKIIGELRKISNGKMARIENHLERLTQIEQVNLNMSGKIYRELKRMRGGEKATPGHDEKKS